MSIQLGQGVFVIVPVTNPDMILQGQVAIHLSNLTGKPWSPDQGAVLAQVVDQSQLHMQQGPPVAQYQGSRVVQPIAYYPANPPQIARGDIAPNPAPRPFPRGDRVPALFQMVWMGIILLISCVNLGLNEWTSYCGISINLQKAGEVRLSDIVDACSVPGQDLRRVLTDIQSCYYCPRTRRNSCFEYCGSSSCGYYCTNPHYDSGDPTTNVCTDTCPTNTTSSGICRYACDYSYDCDHYCNDPMDYSSPERCSESCAGRYCDSCDDEDPESGGSGVCAMSCDDFKLLHRAGQVMLGFGITCIVTSALVILRLGLLFLLRCILLRGLLVKIAIFVVAGMWIVGTGIYVIFFLLIRNKSEDINVKGGLGLAIGVFAMQGVSCVLGCMTLSRIKED